MFGATKNASWFCFSGRFLLKPTFVAKANFLSQFFSTGGSYLFSIMKDVCGLGGGTIYIISGIFKCFFLTSSIIIGLGIIFEVGMVLRLWDRC